MVSQEINLIVSLTLGHRGLRLDQAIAQCFPEHSRSRLTQWIKLGQVSVNGKTDCEPKSKVQGGEQIEIKALITPVRDDLAQSIPLDILYEDETLLVINKPAGLVVHPAAGNPDNTLLNALLHHHAPLVNLPRAGIVHRLDKDTTGLMVVAKTLSAHTALVDALQKREIKREYLALVGAEVIAGDTIALPIGRHSTKRTKMAVKENGKPARTFYRCKQRFDGFTLLHLKLDTGRTHQIRVHLSHIGYPIVGDSLYGWRHKVPPKSSVELQETIRLFQRQALHAFALSLIHPIHQKELSWKAPLPEDFAKLLSLLHRREGY